MDVCQMETVMARISLRFLVAVIAALSVSASVAWTEKRSSEEFALRSIERRAVEATIWGMAAVNYDLMRQEMLTKTAGKENAIVYWSRPLDWHNQTLTPNPDAIYLMAFFNTKEVGPVVLEVPAAGEGSINGNIVNIWQMPLEDAGPSGADAGKGGRYLILPPGYQDAVPNGYIPLQFDTYGGYALLRSNLKSHSEEDIAKSVAYGKRLKVYPLSAAANPPETIFTDAKDVVFDSTIRYDISFFASLNRIIQNEPWLERDRAMIDQLRSLGIEKDKPFNPDEPTSKALVEGIEEARDLLEARYDAGLAPFFEGGRWTVPALPGLLKAAQSAYGDPNAYPIDDRGLTYTFAYIGIKRLGAGQFYLITIKDKDGETFDGSKTYRVHVPPDAPVEQYWSITAYDRQTHALIRSMPRASRSSQIPELKKNTDGSVDIFVGPKAPEGMETNWIPTDSEREFELMLRLYAPTKAFFEKKWVLPDVERVAK
jgi:hypothetical protein